MDLSASWDYIADIARRRLEHNQTGRHVSDYGPEIEVLGAAGELAARRFLGLDERLHENFDGGADLRWYGRRVDVKATHLTPRVHYRFLQWPEWKPVIADIVLMAVVDMRTRTATILGYANRTEVLEAPINPERAYPCHEIPITALHPAWELVVPGGYAIQTVRA